MYTADGNQQQLPRVGVLLVHGLNDGLCNMEELTGFLASYDIVALNVLLPSHGPHVRDRLPSDWSECSHAIHKELQRLKRWCSYVFLIGHSLGGALCLHIAASESVTGVVTICEPVYMYPWLHPAVCLIKHSTPMPAKLREDLRSSEARRRFALGVHGRPPMASVKSVFHDWSLLRTELPSVTAPVLIMTAIHDHVVSARDTQAIYRLIGSQEKYLVQFRRSYLLLMNDPDQEVVFARTLDFIQSHTGKI